MLAPLTRYRAMAYVTGVWLILLVCVTVPLKYVGGHPGPAAVVGMVHGLLYIVYVLVTFELGVRHRWSLIRIGLVALAGTVPFMSFVAERYVTSWVRSRQTDPVAARPAGGLS